jgi:hypothetical protein
MSSADITYIKNNKPVYNKIKIKKNTLVNFDKIKDTIDISVKLPIISIISYDNNDNITIKNFIYKYLVNTDVNTNTNKILDKSYDNIIVYKYTNNRIKCYIKKDINNVNQLLNKDINLKELFNSSYDFEKYYLKNINNNNKYIYFKICVCLIMIEFKNNLIIFDYTEDNIKFLINIEQNIVPTLSNEQISITKKEFNKLNKLVITDTIYKDNPFDYLES